MSIYHFSVWRKEKIITIFGLDEHEMATMAKPYGCYKVHMHGCSGRIKGRGLEICTGQLIKCSWLKLHNQNPALPETKNCLECIRSFHGGPKTYNGLYEKSLGPKTSWEWFVDRNNGNI